MSTCPACVRVHGALEAHAHLCVLSRVLHDKPAVVLCVGSATRNALTTMSGGVDDAAEVESRPLVLVVADECTGDGNEFFDSWSSSLAGARRALDASLPLAPLSPAEELSCFDALLALEPTLMVERVSRRKALDARIARGVVAGPGGTAGYAAAGGRLGAKKPKKAAPSGPVFVAPSTTRLQPVESIARGRLAQALNREQRYEFADSVGSRLRQLLEIYNHLWLVACLADTCRVVSGATGRECVVYDRDMYKLLLGYLCPVPTDRQTKASNNVPPEFAFEMLGLDQALAPTFHVLRDYCSERVLPLIQHAGLYNIVSSIFFGPLANHMVTRVDVVAKMQVLAMLRSVFCAHCEGASDAPSLTIVFAFCGLPLCGRSDA